MARPRKTSPTKGGVSFLEKDRYTAELTSGQLVFGISILLVFGLTCFLLGILVGRFEPAQMQQVAAAPNEEQTTPARTEPATPPERTQLARKSVSVESPPQSGVREDKPRNANGATPTTAAGAATTEQPPAVDIAKATPGDTPRDLTGPRHVAFPDSTANPAVSVPPATAKRDEPASTETTPEAETAAPPTTPEVKSPRAVVIESPLDKPAEDTSASDVPGAVSTSGDSSAIEAPSAETTQVASAPAKSMEVLEPAESPAPSTPVTQPAAGTAGAFSIQVAAMSKESNADALKKRFDAELPYGARIERIPARGLSIVLVGGFESRDAAQAALREFKAKYPNFADAFIRAEK